MGQGAQDRGPAPQGSGEGSGHAREELPGARIKFEYEIFNESGEKLNFGVTTLVFINKETNRPIKCPEELTEKLKKYI